MQEMFKERLHYKATLACTLTPLADIRLTGWYKMRCKLIEPGHLWIHCMHALLNNTYTISYNTIHINHHTMHYIYNVIHTIQYNHNKK